MVREIFKAKAGILFLTDRLGEIGLDPTTVYPDVLERPGPHDVGERGLQKPEPGETLIRPSIRSFWWGLDLDYSIKNPPFVRTLTKSEEDEELNDALAPIYDQMVRKWWWWRALEWLPVRLRHQGKDGKWKTRWG
jgi:hypothetical protein